MALSKSSHPLLLSLLLLLLPTVTLSVTFNFDSFPVSLPNISYEGDALPNGTAIQVTRTQTGDNLQDSVGRAFYKHPIRLWDSATGIVSDFTTHFEFVIDSSDMSKSGDGLAFFLAANSTIPSKSWGGQLALFDSSLDNNSVSRVVAVEFDTYQNEWDPTRNHIGIDINSVVSKASRPWNSKLQNGSRSNAWVTYNATTRNLSVFLTQENNPTFNGNSNLSYEVDMSKVLPECVTVGFSAATGWAIELHTILSWEFNSSLGSCEETKQPNVIVDHKDRRWMVWMSLCLGAFMIGVLVLILIVWRKIAKKRRGNGDLHVDEESMDEEFERETGPRRFAYKELVSATNDFSEKGKLGEGGFGGVYMGLLSDTKETVAVKRISKGSRQGKKEYITEVRIISRLRHRNLVQLMGWCHYKTELLLVYEFMPNGSLDRYLFGKKSGLTWELRYKIALGLSSALLYLHEEWEQCVVHRDIKSSNVMLDSKFNAKLGDFGLARLVDHNRDSQTTVVAGTMGYLAPECVTDGKASKESDVFSLGVVALEICCGRRAIEPLAEASKVRLVEWVWELYGRGRLIDCVDEALSGEFDDKQVECLMVVGLWCAHPDYAMRPSIRRAIQVLNFEAQLPALPSKIPVAMYSVPPTKQSVFSYTFDHSKSSDVTEETSTTTTSLTPTMSSTSYLVDSR
ncbi:hypothetical protein AMTRI_Chr13g89510 [Amborella trichopoda]|uniref:non-specific serine/threonine protein kinase n=1 Tax=Amborella trichopoda TaxID=13333 RepID=U5D762_AMBTC|nr:L-type lectin-domain containing receptor kinase IX.1 [Amborella trichopoda]ERN18050.1 hypothetical protein AMTR_s00046p00199100 [Amborella trichopoda]|eukprot:XP_006856583.1 L-type lectin-domain containing receptor kinase IX.1 [Amborella trichopoda]